jgi:peptidoglycan/xylan/chitin deacetylase (PgdA/CDA1 family)
MTPALAGSAPASRVPILMYHEIREQPLPGFEKYSVTPKAFAAQMRWLALRGYRTIGLDELLAGAVPDRPARPILITFDDGFRGAAEHAAPVLRRQGFTAVFFLVAGLVGGTSRWLRDELGQELPLLDWGVARQLEREGFRCGSHAWSHTRLTELSPGDCREELERSRSVLQDELGHPVQDLAYPHGAYDQRVRELAGRSGYRSACSVRIGLSGADDDRLALARVPICGRDSLPDFVWRLRTGQTPRKYMRDKMRSAWRRLGLRRGASP